jgi:predicted RecA/RadA family phage recombinase
MPNMLRTATPNGDWRSFKFTCEETAGFLGAKAAQAAGSSWLYLVEDTVGAQLEDVAFGDEGVLIYHAEKIMVPKGTDTLDVFLPGQNVYWDPATRLVTAIAETGNYRIGIATEPAIAADEFVEIDLDGAGATAKAIA